MQNSESFAFASIFLKKFRKLHLKAIGLILSKKPFGAILIYYKEIQEIKGICKKSIKRLTD